MMIDEDDNGMVIRLEKQPNTDSYKRRERRLQVLEKTSGILKNVPDSVKRDFQEIADREGEDDREGSQF